MALKQKVKNLRKLKHQTYKTLRTSVFVIVIDIGILALSTDIWKEQLNFLDKYHGKAKFAWMLNHDTSNAIKMELRRKGHLLMVNKPLYKAKMAHILEVIIEEINLELQKKSMNALKTTAIEGGLHESLEIDPAHYEVASSDDSDKSEMGSSNYFSAFQSGEEQNERITNPCPSQYQTVNNCLVELTQLSSKEDNSRTEDLCQFRPNSHDIQSEEQHLICNCPKVQGNSYSSKAVNEQKSLEGLRILLAEDTPVLQRVATIMLEKMGATVIAVGDGLQAVDALKCMLSAEECKRECLMQDGLTRPQTQICDVPPYDLVLMDCQMPKMDGYEATKAIRKSEAGTGLHIPIVALTAHAMSSDEAKCLDVGMDAYLTKPIDRKLMVSTILSLTRRSA
ncbi:hypothetical protein L1049_024519 [Liquidambar formosana]|uniref:Response regulatory domain-containing protein n=1 Tax=Liquidambar formosana TaxID=63359 RepID=A0AAP0RVX4_LIQFO